ncbi:hypothetical protein ACSBR2_014487 [Camellia fascicularis]
MRSRFNETIHEKNFNCNVKELSFDEDEASCMILTEKEDADMKEKWHPSGYKLFMAKVTKIWGLQGDFEALDIGHGFFIVKFDIMEDYTKVLGTPLKIDINTAKAARGRVRRRKESCSDRTLSETTLQGPGAAGNEEQHEASHIIDPSSTKFGSWMTVTKSNRKPRGPSPRNDNTQERNRFETLQEGREDPNDIKAQARNEMGRRGKAQLEGGFNYRARPYEKKKESNNSEIAKAKKLDEMSKSLLPC